MATITLKKIPDELYERLKEAATLNRRSINSEIIVCIERALTGTEISAEEVMVRARKLRRLSAGKALRISELIEAKAAGRR